MHIVKIPHSWPMVARADYYGYHIGIAAFGLLVLIWPINKTESDRG